MSKFKVGQTWRTRGDRDVQIIAKENFNSFRVRSEPRSGVTSEYCVDATGHSRIFGNSIFDLVTRVERCYIAGPMSGYADLNFPAFNAAAKLWRDKGCFVINPAELNGGAAELELYAVMSEEEKVEHYTVCMRKDIAAITTVDTLVVLPGYAMSRGATFEIQVAQFLGLTIVWPESEA